MRKSLFLMALVALLILSGCGHEHTPGAWEVVTPPSCSMEGTRPILCDVQALVCRTAFALPKRSSNGIEYNRLSMLLAVLEKRLGLHFSQHDVYLNVTGGLTLGEPAADMAISLALISGILDKALPDDFIAFGEIGLSGECRSVSFAEQRINEAARLGFHRIAAPKRAAEQRSGSGVELHGVKNLFEAVRIDGLFVKKENKENAQ